MFQIALKQSSKILNVSGTTQTIFGKSWMFRKALKQTSSIPDVASKNNQTTLDSSDVIRKTQKQSAKILNVS